MLGTCDDVFVLLRASREKATTSSRSGEASKDAKVTSRRAPVGPKEYRRRARLVRVAEHKQNGRLHLLEASGGERRAKVAHDVALCYFTATARQRC